MSRAMATAALATALLGTAVVGDAAPREWIATWQASPQPLWSADFPFPTQTPFHLWRQTVRQVARVSLGGSEVRVELSNAYGDAPLHIGAAGDHLHPGDAGYAAMAEAAAQLLGATAAASTSAATDAVDTDAAAR